MPDHRLSAAADADLDAILLESEERWGAARADAYLLSLEEAFSVLADLPALGREAGGLRPGLRRLEHAEHVVFFRAEAGGVLVLRVLHRRILPPRHL